jgi:uncharacterized integral membrane protein
VSNAEGTGGSRPARTSGKKRDNRDMVRLVAGLVIVVLLIAFVIDNSAPVKVHFVFFSASVRLIRVLLITALLGAAADRLLVWRQRHHRRAKSSS